MDLFFLMKSWIAYNWGWGGHADVPERTFEPCYTSMPTWVKLCTHRPGKELFLHGQEEPECLCEALHMGMNVCSLRLANFTSPIAFPPASFFGEKEKKATNKRNQWTVAEHSAAHTLQTCLGKRQGRAGGWGDEGVNEGNTTQLG